MRNQPAPCEQKLWSVLRNRQLNGFKFRRQYFAGRYAADFYCAACRLIVEIDGISHFDRLQYDAIRTQRLSADGFDVIRFGNVDVHENLDGVLETILDACEQRCAPVIPDSHPSP